MSLLTADELADLHATWRSALEPNGCRIIAAGHEDDAAGGYYADWDGNGTAVDCAVLDTAQSVAGRGGEIDLSANELAKVIVFPRGTAIAPVDRIRHVASGQTFQVAGISTAGSYGPAVYAWAFETDQ